MPLLEWVQCWKCGGKGHTTVKQGKNAGQQRKCTTCKGGGGWWVPLGSVTIGLVILIGLFLLFTGCSKQEIVSDWELDYIEGNRYLLIDQTPDNDTIVGYYYFQDGMVDCYNLNNELEFSGEYYFEANYGPWKRTFHIQMWPLGSRVFDVPEIVGNGNIILQALDNRDDFVLKPTP